MLAQQCVVRLAQSTLPLRTHSRLGRFPGKRVNPLEWQVANDNVRGAVFPRARYYGCHRPAGRTLVVEELYHNRPGITSVHRAKAFGKPCQLGPKARMGSPFPGFTNLTTQPVSDHARRIQEEKQKRHDDRDIRGFV